MKDEEDGLAVITGEGALSLKWYLSSMNRYSCRFLLISLFATVRCFAASTASTTHGTVNIVLSNSHGAVVLTDSRLSSNGRDRGSATKLFRLDDATVCSIAGFYSDPGPPDGASLRAATSIPFLIAKYSSRRQTNATIDQKLILMAEVFQFNLAFVAAARNAGSRPEKPPTDSYLTLVGFEDGKIVIAGARLAAGLAGGRFEYVVKEKFRQTAEQQLIHRFAGINDLADTYVSNPSLLATSKDPILKYFGESLVMHGGADLDTHSMLQIARKIEVDTARRHPNEVGGQAQFAILENGKIDDFEALPIDEKVFESYRIRYSGSAITGRSDGSSVGITAPPSQNVILVDGGDLKLVKQPLDEILFVDTVFEDCHLYYDGSPRSYFSADNVLINTDLTLGPGVGEDSVFVEFILDNYPNIIVKRSKANFSRQ